MPRGGRSHAGHHHAGGGIGGGGMAHRSNFHHSGGGGGRRAPVFDAARDDPAAPERGVARLVTHPNPNQCGACAGIGCCPAITDQAQANASASNVGLPDSHQRVTSWESAIIQPEDRPPELAGVYTDQEYEQLKFRLRTVHHDTECAQFPGILPCFWPICIPVACICSAQRDDQIAQLLASENARLGVQGLAWSVVQPSSFFAAYSLVLRWDVERRAAYEASSLQVRRITQEPVPAYLFFTPYQKQRAVEEQRLAQIIIAANAAGQQQQPYIGGPPPQQQMMGGQQQPQQQYIAVQPQSFVSGYPQQQQMQPQQQQQLSPSPPQYSEQPRQTAPSVVVEMSSRDTASLDASRPEGASAATAAAVTCSNCAAPREPADARFCPRCATPF